MLTDSPPLNSFKVCLLYGVVCLPYTNVLHADLLRGLHSYYNEQRGCDLVKVALHADWEEAASQRAQIPPPAAPQGGFQPGGDPHQRQKVRGQTRRQDQGAERGGEGAAGTPESQAQAQGVGLNLASRRGG